MAMFCVCTKPLPWLAVPVYATYSLPSFSMALPEKHPPWGWSSYGSLGANAIGNWVQCSRSSLTAWPQCIFPQNPLYGLNW